MRIHGVGFTPLVCGPGDLFPPIGRVCSVQSAPLSLHMMDPVRILE